MTKYTTKHKQTLVDLSVQLYGGPEFLFNILADSGFDINVEEAEALVVFIAQNEAEGVTVVKNFFRNRIAANSTFEKGLGFGPDFGLGFGAPVLVYDDEVAAFVELKIFQNYILDSSAVSCLNSFAKKLKRI